MTATSSASPSLLQQMLHVRPVKTRRFCWSDKRSLQHRSLKPHFGALISDRDQDLGTSGKETANSKLTKKLQGNHWTGDLQELMRIVLRLNLMPNDAFEEQGSVAYSTMERAHLSTQELHGITLEIPGLVTYGATKCWSSPFIPVGLSFNYNTTCYTNMIYMGFART